MKISLFTGSGTRRWPRFRLSDIPSIKEIRSAAGSRINVVDISRGGALLQTRRLLVPGTTLRLKVVTVEGSIPVAGLVLRSYCCRSEGVSQYRAAVSFDRPLRIMDECPEQIVDMPHTGTYESDEDISMIANFLAIDFCPESDAVMIEMLKYNDW